MNILLIAIGVSKYQSDLFSQLPGAINDVTRISSYFNLWGLERENIITLKDSDATRENILQTIRVETLRRPENIDTIFFYYAGHGENNTEVELNPENILYCYDTYPQDTVGTGIRIQDVITGLQRCQPFKIYLFVDACYVRINHLPDILSAVNEIEEEKRCFFALISTWGKQAYEDIEGGIFTTQLLRGFAYLRDKYPNCMDIAAYIERQSQELSFPFPKGYWIGASEVWFLEDFKRCYRISLNDDEYINRVDSLIEMTDKMLLLASSYNVCFYGHATSGKTILALELSSYFLNYFYYSIKIYDSINQIESELAELIIQELNVLYDDFKGIKSDNLKAVVEYVSFLKLNIVIILDHSERLNNQDLVRLFDELSENNIKIIAFSRVPLECDDSSIVNILCPCFSINEFDEFMTNHNIFKTGQDKLLFYDIYKDKPQKLIQQANNISNDDIFICCKRSIYFICECDGFVNIELFCEMFKVDISDIIKLLNSGLLRRDVDRFVPHESLYEYYAYNKSALMDSKNSENYWSEQLIRTPENSFVCTLGLKLIAVKGISWLKEAEKVVKFLTFYCLTNYKWNDLELMFPFLLKYKLVKLIMDTAEQLAHVARSYILIFDSEILELLNEEQKIMWSIIKSEMFYWIGNFEAAISTCEDIISENPDLSNRLIQKVYLNQGITFFFMGEWQKSYSNLKKISNCSARVDGWKKLIWGTMDAIRGVEFEEGTLMIKDSINILKNINDIIGLGIAYGNLGECYFKKRQYELARYYLETGEAYAVLANDLATHLEILRNKLHIDIVEKCGFDSETLKIKEEMILLLNDVSDKTELMQVYNTLCTASIYSYNIVEAKNFLEKVKVLTEGNLEYELYTCINDAVISYIEGDLFNLDYQLKKIDKLSEYGDNFFAKEQCVKTVYDVKQLYSLGNINLKIWNKLKEQTK